MLTVVSSKGPTTFYRGRRFVQVARNMHLCMPIFKERPDVGAWTAWSSLGRLSMIHHNCEVGCEIRRSCDTHPACHDDCPLSRFAFHHTNSPEMVIYDYYNIVG